MEKINCRFSPALLVTAALTLLASTGPAMAQEKTYRVGLITHSPPMSFTDESGTFTGFNVEIAQELCATMKVRCVQQPMVIDKIVDMAATDQIDFAVVGFVASPERRTRVLFSKEYYQSLSVWVARPNVPVAQPGSTVAVVKGSSQASHAQSVGWKTVQVASQNEMHALLASGAADAALLPMLSSLSLTQDKALQGKGLKTTIVTGPLISGSLHMVINPQQKELVHSINAALDQIKRDGRFDRINRKFIPFSLL